MQVTVLAHLAWFSRLTRSTRRHRGLVDGRPYAHRDPRPQQHHAHDARRDAVPYRGRGGRGGVFHGDLHLGCGLRAGLVAVVPKSGSYVTPINIERYLQACFVRVQLEVGCVRRLASLPLGLEDVTRLRAVLAEQKKALQDKDDARFFALDEKFHHSLFQMAGLPSVWETLNASKAELDRVRHLKRLFGVRRSAHVIREHGEIIDAIAARNPELAEKTLLAHIGGIDDEIARMSEHPHLIKSIDDLNRLVALNRKTRNKRKLA